MSVPELYFFAERGYSLPVEYFDSFKDWLSNSYSVLVWSECYLFFQLSSVHMQRLVRIIKNFTSKVKFF